MINKRISGVSRTIIEFPGMDNVRGRAEASSDVANVYNPGRYVNETVNINLGTATVPKGKAVE